MAAITDRETRLREITNQAVEPGPDSLKEKLDELWDFAVSRLTHLRERLVDPKAIHEARALLAEQIGKFTLERVSENGEVSFKANGQIDFFGEEVLHAWVVPGARIELATPAFSGRRSTGELPRHGELIQQVASRRSKTLAGSSIGLQKEYQSFCGSATRVAC
jgi:hypothetical protein